MQTKISLFALTLLLVPTFTQAGDKPANAITDKSAAQKKETPAKTIVNGRLFHPSDKFWGVETNVLYELEQGTFDGSNKIDATHRLDGALEALTKSNDNKRFDTLIDNAIKQNAPLTDAACELALTHVEKRQAEKIATLKTTVETHLAAIRAATTTLKKEIVVNKKVKSKIKRFGHAKYPESERLQYKAAEGRSADSDDESYDTAYILGKKVISDSPERDIAAIVTLLTPAPAASSSSSSVSPASLSEKIVPTPKDSLALVIAETENKSQEAV